MWVQGEGEVRQRQQIVNGKVQYDIAFELDTGKMLLFVEIDRDLPDHGEYLRIYVEQLLTAQGKVTAKMLGLNSCD